MKKIDHQIIEEPLREWTPWMKAWSEEQIEKARVPVLRVIDDSGTENIIPESNSINLFLDTLDGDQKYTPTKDSAEYQEMTKWWEWCDTTLKPTIDNFKYGENLCFDKEKNIENTKALHLCIKHLEETLRTKKYLIAERLTLADIAIIPFVRQIMRTRGGEFDFSPYPSVVAWTNNIIQTDWFSDVVMKKSTMLQ